MGKAEYDFLTWTSFPSSAKITVEEGAPRGFGWPVTPPTLPVKAGDKLKVEVKAKCLNHKPAGDGNPSRVTIGGWNGTTWVPVGPYPIIPLPLGTFEWSTFTSPEVIVPTGITAVNIGPVGAVGTTWFDDLKLYQNDVLIYSVDFSNWSPVIGAGVGAPIGGVAGYLLKEPLGPMVSEVVGAVVGGALGGGIGLLTGLGIIPVPQIPSLGAAPEEPGAPMRLGKYLVTG